jgi:hypothetical protein
MNFIKTFLITLAIYIGLNAVFLAISIFIAPTFPLDDILFVISTLFSPIANYPETAFTMIVALISTFSFVGLLSFLALIVPPLIAVIIGARLGDTGKISFLSWCLTAIISSVVYLLILIFGQDASVILAGIWASFEFAFGLIGTILYVIFAGVVSGFFYGCFSFLFSKD